jgi:hypothetical protein
VRKNRVDNAQMPVASRSRWIFAKTALKASKYR